MADTPFVWAAAYNHAQQHAVYSASSTTGSHIWASGLHRLDLPHRLSTNNLNSLSAGQAQPTVLTTAIGRIIDLLWVLHCGERVMLLTSPAQGASVRLWLSRNIFFNDQVRFDLASELHDILLVGGNAQQRLTHALPNLPALAIGQVHAIDAGWVVRLPDWRTLAVYRLIATSEQLAQWQTALTAAQTLPAPPELFDVLRIEAGQPAAQHEITNEYIPLEVGLRHAVSFTKGCYIGQEIIARLDSRGRLAKTLVGLHSTQALGVGQRLTAETGERGIITSAAFSPQFGYIGLGVIKPSAAIAGTVLNVLDADNQAVQHATVHALPFASL